MDHLFNRLDGMYPHRWRSAFPNDQAIQNWRAAWADGFSEEGITLDEIRGGMSVCRRLYDWPPSLGEFIKCCRPSMDYERAYLEANEQMYRRREGWDVWSNTAIYWAACAMGNDLSNHPYKVMQNRWAAALDKAIDQVKRGSLPSDVPVKLTELPAPGKTTVSQEQAAANIIQIKTMLNRSTMTQEAA